MQTSQGGHGTLVVRWDQPSPPCGVDARDCPVHPGSRYHHRILSVLRKETKSSDEKVAGDDGDEDVRGEVMRDRRLPVTTGLATGAGPKPPRLVPPSRATVGPIKRRNPRDVGAGYARSAVSRPSWPGPSRADGTRATTRGA